MIWALPTCTRRRCLFILHHQVTPSRLWLLVLLTRIVCFQQTSNPRIKTAKFKTVNNFCKLSDVGHFRFAFSLKFVRLPERAERSRWGCLIINVFSKGFHHYPILSAMAVCRLRRRCGNLTRFIDMISYVQKIVSLPEWLPPPKGVVRVEASAINWLWNYLIRGIVLTIYYFKFV